MATSTINGITLTYPDDPCMVFSPCLFTLVGTMARTRVYVSSSGRYYSAVYHTPNGGTLDLRQFMQSFFDGLEMGKDLDGITYIKQSELGRNVSLTIMPLDSTGATLAQFNVTIFCVWGAFAVGEDSYYMYRNITWFKRFPLTVGIYAPLDGYINIGQGQVSVAVPAYPSMVNVVVDVDTDQVGEEFNIERTFMRNGHYVSVIEYTVKTDDHDEGVYLRWIDRHGFWRYWLFKAGDQTRQAASRFGAWYRNHYSDYANRYGWQGSAGRRQSYTRNDVQPLCAPLVDQDTFDMLQDITTSPCVDMYLGKYGGSSKWTAVTVEPGSYTKDVKKPEQDFLCNIILPEIPVQTL